jgi:hypothetical protein
MIRKLYTVRIPSKIVGFTYYSGTSDLKYMMFSNCEFLRTNLSFRKALKVAKLYKDSEILPV